MAYKLSELLEAINTLSSRLDPSEVDVRVNKTSGSGFIDNDKIPSLSLTTTTKKVGDKTVVTHILDITPVVEYRSGGAYGR